MKKQYTLDEKIDYYKSSIRKMGAQLVLLEDRIEVSKKRLAYLMSDEYQDWSGDISKTIAGKSDFQE